MTRLGGLRTLALAAVFLATSNARGQETNDPTANFVGVWVLRGTTTSVEINADHTVRHSEFGEGVIKHDVGDYFYIYYRQQLNPLECFYQIRKFSEDELDVVKAFKTYSVDCDLGTLRRAPGSPSESEGAKKEGQREKDSQRESEKLPPSASASSPMPPTAEKAREGEKPLSGANSSTSMPPMADEDRRLLPTTVFKDCDSCPNMVVIPAGDFDMGSPDAEPGRLSKEGPRHKVSFARPFAVGRFAITRDEFNAFVTASGYQYGTSCHAEVGDKWVELPNASFLSPPGFTQEGRHPAVCISWKDANEYVKWLSAQTQKNYRLLTEAEREYIARAGTSTPYWWGEAVTPEHANYDKRMRPTTPAGPKANQSQKPKDSAWNPSHDQKEVTLRTVADTPQPGEPMGTPGHTTPVDWFPPNAWGIYQVHGNVAEWVQDCWNSNYIGAPMDGSAAEVGDCSRRVLRGGGWNHWPEDIRAAYREAAPSDQRYYEVGFRVARNLGN